MCSSKKSLFLLSSFVLIIKISADTVINTKNSQIWGPGLQPHIITMPARYFFIQAADDNNKTITSNLENKPFQVAFDGSSKFKRPCRIWHNVLNRKDGSFIVRYKLYEPCLDLKIIVTHEGSHVAESPYHINNVVYPDDCDCASKTINQFLEEWKCGPVPQQIKRDLEEFPEINWDQTRKKVIALYDQPLSVSLCHYAVKGNNVYRKCYGKYVGFKMFMDNILLSMARKMVLPDLEFFVNLGDWPLVKTQQENKFPVFSWCGSTDTEDIVMPTYDITESTLENMGRVMLDMLSVQGNTKDTWDNRIPKVFWRGRDSNQERLDLIEIGRKYPELFNVSLTNFFFFRDQVQKYGPKSDHVSFFDFFDYKYQLAIDGTVAAYRFPYLLAGGSLVVKQASKYYEHFYNDLIPNFHYIPMNRDLSNLVEKLKWALDDDEEARKIAKRGQDFANENLLPQQIFCYHAHLLNEFEKRITNQLRISEDMEKVDQVEQKDYCDCTRVSDNLKDEL